MDLSPEALQRADQIAQARKSAESFSTFLRTNALGAAVFNLRAPFVDAVSAHIGRIAEELKSFGYEMRSVSHSIVNEVLVDAPDGTKVPILNASFAMFVVAIGDKPLIIPGRH